MNIHAETTKPQNFFIKTVYVVILTALLIAAFVGYAGYFAFGNSVKSVIIYNLPHEDPIAITVKFLYLFTVMGSFVLLTRPVFHIFENSMFYKTGRCCVPSPE